MLSVLFALVFGFWWDSSAPFKVHLSILASALAVFLSAILIVNIYPKIQRRSLATDKYKKLDQVAWGQDISTKLSTPAAVIEGYIIKFANNAFLNELGMSGMREYVTDMPLTNLVHPGSHQALNNIIVQKSDLETNETTMLRMLYADGTTIPVQVSFSPLGQGEQPNQFLLQFSPTSTTEPIKSSSPQDLTNQMLIDRIEQIIFQINADQEIIFLNPSWERILDYSSSESKGKPLLSFIHPEDQPLAEARINALTEGKRQHSQFEVRLIAKNGHSHWFEMRASTTSKLKGERTSILGTLTDISRMKSATAGRKANARSATNMILPNIPCMLYRCKNDRNWTFDFASEGCLEVTGYQVYEVTNSSQFNYMQLIYPDDQQRVWEHVQEQINKQQSFDVVYRIMTRSNQIKWVMQKGKGIFSGSTELLGLEGVIIDLTSQDHDALKNGIELMCNEQKDKAE
jgi:PAS domain S-box-containing protein